MTDSFIFPGQPVRAFLGLKRRQWHQKSGLRIMAREHLESKGANVLKVECFLKTDRGLQPRVDPNVVNLFLKLHNDSVVVIT